MQTICEKNLVKDKLKVKVYNSPKELGLVAGKTVAAKIREVLKTKETINMIFAAAPSQNEFLEVLSKEPDIDWNRVIAFHLDEYIGLPELAPQSFSRYLREHLFDLVHPGEVHYLNGRAETPEDEGNRYSNLLAMRNIDIACIGIGENGHIAFNDPSTADFNDSMVVKVVKLDEKSRIQQVHDGCFNLVTEVPTHALTITIPTLMSAKWIFCIVPGHRKSLAVKNMVYGSISKDTPASILRTHENAILYLDTDSFSELGPIIKNETIQVLTPTF